MDPLGHPFDSKHAAPDGARVGFWGAPSINTALLTELSKSRVLLKTGKIRVLARLSWPMVGTPSTLPHGITAEARAIALPAWLSLGRITAFTHSNLVHGPAEKGLPVQGRLAWPSGSEEELGTTNTLAWLPTRTASNFAPHLHGGWLASSTSASLTRATWTSLSIRNRSRPPGAGVKRVKPSSSTVTRPGDERPK
jgi:hypothetical protein